MMRDRDQLSVRAKLRHIRVVRHRHLSLCFRGSHHRRRIGVMRDHIGPLRNQCVRRIALLARVIPGVDPHDAQLRLWIRCARAKDECIDALQDFRNRKRSNIAERVGLAHPPRNHAGQIPSLVKTRVVGVDVGCGLVTGGVLEIRVFEFLRHLQRRIHETERRREYQLMTLLRQIANHALGVRALRHLFHERRADLGSERLCHLLAPGVVLRRPACITDRAYVDEADLQRLSGGGR